MDPKEFVKLYDEHGSIRAVAKASGLSRHKVHTAAKEAYELGLIEPQSNRREYADRKLPVSVSGRVKALKTDALPLPPRGKINRYYFTCAQNNTLIHKGTWENLLALTNDDRKAGEVHDAKLMVARIFYVKQGLGAHGDKIQITAEKNTDDEVVVWDPAVLPYVVDGRVEVAPGIIWCGEMNILPTAVRPLSGLEVYTGIKSGIFPHVKVAMESVATGRYEPTKFNYTTGTVTLRNYIQRKAGLKAEFHHCLDPDTKFLTDHGIKTLRETCGQGVKVWSGTKWECAKIRSFGRQQLNEIKMVPAVLQDCNGTLTYREQSSNLSHIVRATPDHEWVLSDGSRTRSLSRGDIIPASTVTPVNKGPDFEEGVRHGLIFGDGSVTYQSIKDGRFSHQLCIHGDAAGRWVHLFGGVGSLHRWASREHISNYIGTVYWKSATNMKDLPAEDANPDYIRGFFVGWIAADGNVNKRDAGISLCSVHKEALQWAVDYAPYAGFVATGIAKGSGGVSSFGRLRNPCWRLTLVDTPRYWKIKEISSLPGLREVMCAVVHPSHAFTLAGGVLTGNCYGALMVEVDHEGRWFARQLIADSEGTIHDLNRRAMGGEVEYGHWVEAVTWGDVHASRVDPSVREAAWGVNKQSMIEVLRPRYQFIHDIFDFNSRTHHDRRNHHQMFAKFVNGDDSVQDELDLTAHLIVGSIYRNWCQTIIVESNHDNMLERWLRDDPAWYTRDPVNAEMFLELQLMKYQAISRCDESFLLIERAFKKYTELKHFAPGEDEAQIKFLLEDESFVICPDAAGGIECGQHGHHGINGARPSINSFAKMGRKRNDGHSHTAGIMDGAYKAGTSSVLDLGFNKGPSSWSHSHIVTYENGKRTMITMKDGHWRASVKTQSVERSPVSKLNAR